MNSQNRSEEELVLCARCAWREFCVKKFSFDNTKPIKCPDFSLDMAFKRGEEKGAEKKDKRDT